MQEQMRSLVQGIIGAYEARASGLASLQEQVVIQRNEARGHIKDLRRTRQVAVRQQRDDLAKGHADLRASVGAQLQELDRAHNAMGQRQRDDLSKGHADLRASVSTQLQELDRSHNAMARHQREGLAKVHADVNRAETRRKAGVRSWMEGVAAAHGAAREEWQNLAATVQAKRAGAVVEASTEVAPAPRAVEEVAPAAPVAEEEDAVEVGEVTEELTSLSARVFEHLANHPDGTRLTELEYEFGFGRFQAARLVRHLMNEGKAAKQGLLYFAT